MRNNITSMVKTIKINDDIHARLLRIGSMGETFEDVIKKLLDFYENKNKK
jgi:predicted CopG family antitoxin